MQQKMGQVDPQASQAVNKALDNITPMLSKLDNKTLGLLLQLTQYLKKHKAKYKELMAKLAAKGSIPAGVFPDEYDPKFLSVFALSVARAQKSREGMAAGGIADVAQHMKDQGRGKDTMLAHISPKEAELLRANGGVGTLNPTTGLPEFNIFDDIGDGLKGFGDFIGDVLRPFGDAIGDILQSPLGKAAAIAAGMYFLGAPTVSALGSSALPGDAVLSAALPGDVAALAGEQVASLTPEAIAHLTPAAIESGMGTPGYGFSASAAESGLFDPANIGAGAASDFPTSGLTAKDILKKGKDLLSKDTEKEKQSDPNEMAKLMAMLEMINSQNQPKDLPIAKLPDNSQLPYDSPVKKKSAYPSYVQTAADGGLMMDQRYDIGGLTAERTQTDYMKQMSDPSYRPGQGGVTYFSPVRYKPLTAKNVLPGQDPTKQTAIDELLNQIGKNAGRSTDASVGSYGNGYPGATTDIYGDSGPLTGMAAYMNQLAAYLGNKGFVKLSDVIARNIDPNYGHEGKVGLRKAEAAAEERIKKLYEGLPEEPKQGAYLPPSPPAEEPKQGAYLPGTGPLVAPDPYTNPLTGDYQNPMSVGLPAPPNESQAETNRLLNAGVSTDATAGLSLGQIVAALKELTTPGSESSTPVVGGINTLPAGYVNYFDFDPTDSQPMVSLPAPEAPAPVAAPEAAAPAFSDYSNEGRSGGYGGGYGGGDGGATNASHGGDSGGWGSRDAGGGDARGGYLNNGKFDQRYADGGITSLAEGGDIEEELRKRRRGGGRGLSIEQQQERDDPKAWGNLTDEQKTEYYSNNPGMLGFSEGALNLWSGSLLGRLQNYFDPSRQDTQRRILETAKADAKRYGETPVGNVSSGSLSSQIRGQDKANLRDLPYDAPVSGITSLDTKNPYIKSALLSNSKEEIDKKLSLFNQGINPETGDSKVASGFNDIKNNTAAFLGNLGLTSLSDSIAKTVNSDYGHEGAVGLRMAEQAAQERAAQEAAVERVVEQLERTGPPPAESSPVYSRPAEIINIPSNENYSNEGRDSVAPDSLSDRSFSPAYGGTSYGSVDSGYAGGSEAARGGLLDSRYAHGGITALGGYNLGSYSDGGRLLRGPGDGVSDDIPAMIGNKQPARLANGEFVIPARIVSELGNGSTDAGAKRLYEMMARIQKVRRKTKNVAANTKAAKYLPA